MKRKFIDRVTVTGADNNTDIAKMMDLSKEYPFAEFGILMMPGRHGSPRFPSQHWLGRLYDACGSIDIFPKLSAHLCGQYVHDFLEKDEFSLIIDRDVEIFNFFFSIFGRVQINTHGYLHEFNPSSLKNNIRICGCNTCSVILQYDNANNDLFDFCKSLSVTNLHALYDSSHGAGVLPASWEVPFGPGVFTGYSGGLSVDNLKENIEKISDIVDQGVNIWIDAETHLRSRNCVMGDFFDLALVEKFLQIASDYVVD